jgi:hypothetical protein
VTTREDVKDAEPELTEPEIDRLLATGRQPSGRIVHDERGNAVWKWFGDNSTTTSRSPVLENIDPLDLKVDKVFDAGGGYDPYNQRELRIRTAIPKTASRGKR